MYRRHLPRFAAPVRCLPKALKPSRCPRVLSIQNMIFEQTDPLYADFHNVACLHENRGAAREPDTGRCSGDQQISRFEHEGFGCCDDQLRDRKDEITSGSALHDSSVQACCENQICCTLWQFVRADNGRAEACGAVEILAERPLGTPIELIIAKGCIVENRIARDSVEGVGK